MAMQKGFGASFMARPDDTLGGGSGAHFNCSVFDKATKKNVFHDPNSKDKLSSTAKHWCAGMIQHAPALTALCSPTVNCYRRLHSPFAPDICDWNFDDRNSYLRIKVGGENGTYMENRLPSSAANPYIVMAATIAAGIDGINRKLSPPSPHDTGASKLPFTLSEALDELEKDTALTEVLGKDFVDCFIASKREVDLTKLKDHDPTKFVENQLATEIAEYDICP